MWWKDSERGRDFSRPEYTAQDIIAYYAKQEKPIDGETVFRLLEPLAGTSFMALAIRQLGIHFWHQRRASQKTVFPADIADFWFRDIYPHQVEKVTDAKLLEEATL